VVTQAKLILTCLDLGFPDLWIIQFAIWQVSNPKLSPTCLDSRFPDCRRISNLRLGWSPKPNYLQRIRIQGSEQLDLLIWDLGHHPSQINPDVFGLKISRPLDHPIWILDSLQIPNHPRHVWTQDFQTIEEYPIWDLSRHSSQINPDVFGLRISRPLDHPIWILDNFQAPNYPRHVWTQEFQTVEEYPIWDLGGHPNQTISNVFGSKDPNSWISRFETWVVTHAKLSPTCLDLGFPDRWITQFGFWIVSKSQIIPDMFGLRISKLSKNTRFETWVVTQAKLTPTCLDSGSLDCWITRFETWVVTQAKSLATCLDSGFPNCQICPKLRFETSFKSRFPNQVKFILFRDPSKSQV
jgi:hypothetical protein